MGGVSRSSSFIIAYLMKTKQMKFQDAFTFLVSKHKCASPNDGFITQLKEYETKLFKTKPAKSKK